MYCSVLVTSLEKYWLFNIWGPFSRTETFKNSFFTWVCRAWNELSLSIRESNTLPVFRKKLFNYFCDKFSANFYRKKSFNYFYDKFGTNFFIVIILFLSWV